MPSVFCERAIAYIAIAVAGPRGTPGLTSNHLSITLHHPPDRQPASAPSLLLYARPMSVYSRH
eukprot:4819032-Prymnesium_polylepis.1